MDSVIYSNDRVVAANTCLDDIIKAKILARHVLSGQRYGRAGMAKRKQIRASAYCMNLARWVK